MKPRIEPDRQRNPELPLAVNETPNGAEGRPPLLPVRYPDPDLFICAVLDAIPKDDMASSEHPTFSLATKPARRVLRNEHNAHKLEIVPPAQGQIGRAHVSTPGTNAHHVVRLLSIK